MTAAQRQLLRRLQKALRAIGVSLQLHGCDAPLLRWLTTLALIDLFELSVDDLVVAAA
jgi:hypothetical protein